MVLESGSMTIQAYSLALVSDTVRTLDHCTNPYASIFYLIAWEQEILQIQVKFTED
jgi:hypothetical protein